MSKGTIANLQQSNKTEITQPFSYHAPTLDHTNASSGGSAVIFLWDHVFVTDEAYTPSYLHNDYLGSVRRITDKGGNLTWSRDYYPFGEERSASGTGSKYTYEGKERDEEAELWNNGARFFNHDGRFTEVDPQWTKYPSMSPYARVANNPLRYVDPNGEDITSKEEEDDDGNVYIEIVYTATLIMGETDAFFSSSALSAIAGAIKKQIEESYSGSRTLKDGRKVTWSTKADIKAGGEPRTGDNLIKIQDLQSRKPGEITLGKSGAQWGHPSSVFYLNTWTVNNRTSFEIGRTGAHEFGHTVRLVHPELKQGNNLMIPSRYSSGTSINYDQIRKIHQSANFWNYGIWR